MRKDCHGKWRERERTDRRTGGRRKKEGRREKREERRESGSVGVAIIRQKIEVPADRRGALAYTVSGKEGSEGTRSAHNRGERGVASDKRTEKGRLNCRDDGGREAAAVHGAWRRR
jgi:hypothetical protein